MRITTVTCVRNEGPFLLEWIAYNRLIGVTDFLFYSNDCTDGTDRLLDALAHQGIVQHLPNPAQGRAYQMEALKNALGQSVVHQTDWLWISDVDEFLNIHIGHGTIPELIEAAGNPQAISINFQFFGNCDVADYHDRPVIAQFGRSHTPDIWCASEVIEVKTLIRKDFPLRYLGAHRPYVRRGEAFPVWTNGSGQQVSEKFMAGQAKFHKHKIPAPGARRFATLNHYALRSVDSYLVKNDRGDVNRENRAFDEVYWRERNDDAYFDPSIQRHLPALEAEIAALKILPGIAALHDETVEAHRARIADLRADPDIAETRARLIGMDRLTPPELALLERLA